MFSFQANIETQIQGVVQILTMENIKKTCPYLTFKCSNLQPQSNFPL